MEGADDVGAFIVEVSAFCVAEPVDVAAVIAAESCRDPRAPAGAVEPSFEATSA